jgi:hypothetical protein
MFGFKLQSFFAHCCGNSHNAKLWDQIMVESIMQNCWTFIMIFYKSPTCTTFQISSHEIVIEIYNPFPLMHLV